MLEQSQFVVNGMQKPEVGQNMVDQGPISKRKLETVNGFVKTRCFDQLVSSPENRLDRVVTPATPRGGSARGFLNLSVCDESGQAVRDIHLKFDLFHEKMPRTCENFMKLCVGTVDRRGQKMQYKNSLIYEILPRWVVVGGDFVNNNGTGGKAVFQAGVFEDEGFTAADYSEPGLLCMLSHGPHTNNSIFFITMKPAPWLKGLYVAFGKVTEGLESLERLSEEVGTKSGVPSKIVRISTCGATV